MQFTKTISKKARILRSSWEQEKPAFYQKISSDEKALQIVNALAEMIAREMTYNQIRQLQY